MYNPKYDEMWAPKYGPEDPNISEHHRAVKNTLSGYVEKACVNDFQFENQRKTFHSYGYAVGPNGDEIIGDAQQAASNNGEWLV